MPSPTIHNSNTTTEIEYYILNFGANVKKYRQQNGWTQEQLAERLESSKQWISAIERGKPSVKLETVVKLALALNVQVSQLMV